VDGETAGLEHAGQGTPAAAVDTAALLGEYAALIKGRIEGAKFYPAAAERQRQRGTVRVSFVVGADGAVSGIRVRDGSGHPALDEAAVEAVRRAGRFPAIPQELARASLSLSVALKYSLD
jgi:protein TonB